MKKYIIVLAAWLLLCPSAKLKATGIDSLFLAAGFEADLLLQQTQRSSPGIIAPYLLEQTQSVNNKQSITQKKDIFSAIVNAAIWLTTILREEWGEYKEPGYKPNPPFTTFNSGATISQVRTTLYNTMRGTDNTAHTLAFYNTYAAVYTSAKTTGLPANCIFHGVCDLATVAKNAAFVYLMGIGIRDNGDVFQLSDTTTPTRASFYNQAKNILMKGMNMYSFSNYIPADDNLQYRDKDLLMLLQAHEYLWIAKNEGMGYNQSTYEDVRTNLVQITRNLFVSAGTIQGELVQYNNHSLMSAAALGLASIILHDKQAHFWAPNKWPKHWANTANAYINRTMKTGMALIDPLGTLRGSQGPMSNSPNGNGGYAEGPHYFTYGFESLLPFFVAYNAFLNDQDGTRSYKAHVLSFGHEDVKNYIKDPFYDELYRWYLGILQPNETPPSYDDAYLTTRLPALAILGKKEFSVLQNIDMLTSLKGPTGLYLHADYLGALNFPNKPNFNDIYKNTESGDLVVRNSQTDSIKNRQYIHVSAEKGTAINGYRPFGYGHEHGDVTSFVICAGEDVLALDPAEYGEDEIDNVNQGHHHNVITIDDEGPDPRDQAEYSDILDYGDYKLISVKANYWSRINNLQTDKKAIVERQIEAYQNVYPPYYIINDKVTNREVTALTVRFNLNGNGSDEDAVHSFTRLSDTSALWDHPCNKDNYADDNWKMLATNTSQYVKGTDAWPSGYPEGEINVQTGSTHGNNSLDKYNNPGHPNDLIAGKGHITNMHTGGYGKHTRMTREVYLYSDKSMNFQTSIQMYRCPDYNYRVPKTTMNDRYTSHLLTLDNNKLYNFHLSRSTNSTVPDTVINPFSISGSEVLSTDARSIMFSYSPDTVFQDRNCISYTHFRKARINEGKVLTYKGDTLIKSNQVVTAFYSLIGKFQYEGYIESNGNSQVKFYLPDLQPHYKMKVTSKGSGIFTFSYDTNTFIMTVNAPTGLNRFVIELVEPCLMDCFFPPTAEHIDTLFDFKEGIMAHLGHKLEITTPDGFLNISKGSTMSICSGMYLINHDSLIMSAGCPQTDTTGFALINCYAHDDFLASVTPMIPQPDQRPSRIIINSGGALVLDNNSYTRVGNNCKIEVMAQGSLVIKAGAFLNIGDNQYCGHAEIIAYPGSFVQIEDSAWIQFQKMIGDTIDKHMFFIAQNPPGHTGSNATNGIYPAMRTSLITDGFVSSGATAVSFCSIEHIRAPYGIVNRDWGYANFVQPKAWAQLPDDTICPGECMLIKFNASLNDFNREVSVCRIDTVGVSPTYPSGVKETCADLKAVSIPKKNYFGDVLPCDTTVAQRNQLTYCSVDSIYNHWNAIRIKAYNQCGEVDSIRMYFYAMPPMYMNISVPDSACAGSTVTITNYTLAPAPTAKWHVHLIDTTQYQEIDTSSYHKYYSADWETGTTTSGTTFNFPGFRFYGGFRYAVSLTLTNRCGDSTAWDTIKIYPGAYIDTRQITTYASPLAPGSVQLLGTVLLADSFKWSPTTNLTNPLTLTPTAAPTTSTNYILTAYRGTCVERDTAFITINTAANAGIEDSACFGTDTIIKGSSYDASIFFGLLYYYGGNNFPCTYLQYLANNANFFTYFTRFMLHSYGKTQLNASTTLKVFLTTPALRDKIFKQRWFPLYYKKYLQYEQNYPTGAFYDFKAFIDSDPALVTFLSSYNIWSTDINTVFANYNTTFLGGGQQTQVQSSWQKIVNGTATTLSSWANRFIIVEYPQQTTTYRVTVTKTSPSVTEIDEATAFIDTTLSPEFSISLQADSTIYFDNTTRPVLATTTFSWNFGDGSPLSKEINPVHTFPHFNQRYRVCLTAKNKCGTYTYCDTVRVDSIGMAIFYKRAIDETANSSAVTEEGTKLINYPNPFNDKTIIEYEINKAYQHAEIKIINVVGQEVMTTELNAAKGKIQMDGGQFSAGMYYYSLIIDGRVSNSRIMVLQK